MAIITDSCNRNVPIMVDYNNLVHLKAQLNGRAGNVGASAKETSDILRFALLPGEIRTISE